MNILLITPGINKLFNDNYHIYSFISKSNNILAITQKQQVNKGRGIINREIEIDGNLVIRREYDSLKEQYSIIRKYVKYRKYRKVIEDFQPDLILCEEISNIFLAVRIKRDFKIPLILRVEFAYNPVNPYRTMEFFLKKFKTALLGDSIPIMIGKFLWNWTVKRCDSIISCYFEDSNRSITGIPNYREFYIPWPTYVPDSFQYANKKIDRMVFIGAFDKHKNLKELIETIPLILRETHINEFIVIGNGEDEKYIDLLKKSFPISIVHYQYKSRIECLEIIQQSFVSYSPATRGGWGFIGDSFAVKTPLLITHNHYNFTDNFDAIVCKPKQLSKRINDLLKDDLTYNRIAENGYVRYKSNLSAKSVSKKYMQVFNHVLEC